MAIEQWHIDAPKTIDLEVVRNVRVNFMGGALNVIAHDLPTTRVEVSAITGRDLKVSIDGDTLLIDHPQLGWGALGTSARTLFDQPRATVSVLVPKKVSVNVKATSADVLIVGVDGDITIATVGGEHFADNTHGKLQLFSAGGELSVRGHTGSVQTQTATGDVTVKGPITSFDGNTVSGSTVIEVEPGAAAPSVISNSSVSGATTIRLPDDTNMSVQATTVAAKIQVGDTLVDPLYGKQYRRAAGALEQPVTEIKVNTVAGRIVILGGSVAPEAATGFADAADANAAADSAATDAAGAAEATSAAGPADASTPGAANAPSEEEGR